MENQPESASEPIVPTPTPSVVPPTVVAEPASVYIAPEALAGAAGIVSPATNDNWNNPVPAQSASSKLGLFSLFAGLLAVILTLGMIIIGSPLSSTTTIYVSFAVYFALSIAGLVLGILSEKSRNRISITGLLGIILAVIVCFSCLTAGAFYVKFQMTMNALESSYEVNESKYDYNN